MILKRRQRFVKEVVQDPDSKIICYQPSTFNIFNYGEGSLQQVDYPPSHVKQYQCKPLRGKRFLWEALKNDFLVGLGMINPPVFTGPGSLRRGHEQSSHLEKQHGEGPIQ